MLELKQRRYDQNRAKSYEGKKLGTKLLVAVILTIVCNGALMIAFEAHKAGLHKDEAYTISSSVSPAWDDLLATTDSSGNPLVKSRQDYEQSTYFQEFNPAMVYENQVRDVHPPLYYLLFHLLAFFFRSATFQIAFVINLFFFLISEWLIVKIGILLKKANAILPALLFYGFSYLGINMVTFQRMYCLLTFFAILILYLNLKIYKQNFQISKKEAIGFGLATTLGFLTQYYFVFILFFCVATMFLLMRKKKVPKTLQRKYLLVPFLGLLCGVLLYPASVYQVLFGSRGVGAMAKMQQNVLDRSLAWLQVMKENIYVPVLIFAVVLVILIMRTRKRSLQYWPLFFVPSLFYLLFVMILSPYVEIRYLMPGLALFILGFCFLLDEYVPSFVLLGGVLITVIIGGLLFTPSFLYSDYKNILNRAEVNSDKTLIYITDNNFTFIKNLPEYDTYSKTIIVKEPYGEIDKLHLNPGQYVLRFESYMDKDKILEELARKNISVVETWDLGTDAKGYLVTLGS